MYFDLVDVGGREDVVGFDVRVTRIVDPPQGDDCAVCALLGRHGRDAASGEHDRSREHDCSCSERLTHNVSIHRVDSFTFHREAHLVLSPVIVMREWRDE